MHLAGQFSENQYCSISDVTDLLVKVKWVYLMQARTTKKFPIITRIYEQTNTGI
jgi:hypothetical protein